MKAAEMSHTMKDSTADNSNAHIERVFSVLFGRSLIVTNDANTESNERSIPGIETIRVPVGFEDIGHARNQYDASGWVYSMSGQPGLRITSMDSQVMLSN